MWSQFRLDGQYFNIVRGDTAVGEQIKRVPPSALPGIYSFAAELTRRYGDRMFADDEASTRFVKNVAYVGTIATHYRAQHANFQSLVAWPFPCTAGETTVVVDFNGDVRACELRAKNLPASRLRLRLCGPLGEALWAANERQKELQAIDRGKACWCTHVCFIHDSLRHSRRGLLYEVPKNYLRRTVW